MSIFYGNKVYDILVSIGGANESDRRNFLHAHCTSRVKCSEWRFQGVFGFGGKYRSGKNRIDYYPEDRSEYLDSKMDEVNNALATLKTELQ